MATSHLLLVRIDQKKKKSERVKEKSELGLTVLPPLLVCNVWKKCIPIAGSQKQVQKNTLVSFSFHKKQERKALGKDEVIYLY